MKFIAFTNNFFGTGKTKQKALINVLNELEQNNAQAKMIKFSIIEEDEDPFDIMEKGFHKLNAIKI